MESKQYRRRIESHILVTTLEPSCWQHYPYIRVSMEGVWVKRDLTVAQKLSVIAVKQEENIDE